MIEDEDADIREFTASEVCTVVNCAPGTLRSWRRRNGLFPETMLSGGWNYFSLADMAATKLVVDLTASGYTAQTAVNIAMKMLPIIEKHNANVPPSKKEGETFEQWLNTHWPNYVVRVDARGGISFLSFDASMPITKVFEEIGVSGLFVINMSNLMDLQEGLDILTGLRPPRKKTGKTKTGVTKRKAPPKRGKR